MPEKHTYFYYIPELGHSPTDSRKLKSEWGEHCLNYVAEDAAQHEWFNHDGWEWLSSGCDELVLLSDDMQTELGRFKIQFGSVPEFSASKKSWVADESH